jgi:hypothetical protein
MKHLDHDQNDKVIAYGTKQRGMLSVIEKVLPPFPKE